MGRFTYFYRQLEFTRKLSKSELAEVQTVLHAGRFRPDDKHIETSIHQLVEGERDARGGKGPLIYSGPDNSRYRAARRSFVTGPDLNPGYAGDLRITKDERGLEYCSEKSYHMVEGVNFIIVNARLRIRDFGLKGQLLAVTEFEPWIWWLRIGADGLAHQIPLTDAEREATRAERERESDRRMKREAQYRQELHRYVQRLQQAQRPGFIRRWFSRFGLS